MDVPGPRARREGDGQTGAAAAAAAGRNLPMALSEEEIAVPDGKFYFLGKNLAVRLFLFSTDA